MNAKVLPSLVALALVGCFNPVAAVSGDTPIAVPDELPINGELRIEVLLPPANEQGVAPEAFVFLGDGSRHLQRLGEDGRAVFTDPALTGPQDITFVWSYPQADGTYSRTSVYTALEVNRKEVYLEPYAGPRPQVPEREPVGTVTGRVLGISDEPHAVVVVAAFSDERVYGWVSGERHGEAFPGGVFEFSMGLKDVPEGPLSFVAYEMRDYVTHRAGRVKDVVVGTSENAPVEIAIAPFSTENIKIEARGGFEGRVQASMTASLGRIRFFERYVSGALPIEVPAVSLEGEWAGLSRTGCLSRSEAGNRNSFAAAPLGSATTASLDLFDFPTVVEPPNTSYVEPSVVSASEPFELVWKADSRATTIEIFLAPESPGATLWQIKAPASRRSFRLPTLPAALAHLKLETMGTYEIAIMSMKAEKYPSFSSRFVRRPPIAQCAAYEGGSQSYASTSGRFVRE